MQPVFICNTAHSVVFYIQILLAVDLT